MSFVANWFVNLADTIQAFQPKAGVKILSTWVSTTSTLTTISNKNYHQTWHSEGKFLWDYGNGGFERSSGPYGRVIKYSCAEVNTVISKSRVPGVKPRMPSFDIKLDPFKIADMAIIFKKGR